MELGSVGQLGQIVFGVHLEMDTSFRCGLLCVQRWVKRVFPNVVQELQYLWLLIEMQFYQTDLNINVYIETYNNIYL